jgi:hypothetical protein
MLKCANLRGDADTVTAITGQTPTPTTNNHHNNSLFFFFFFCMSIVGQLVGALYGIDAIPPNWIARVERKCIETRKEKITFKLLFVRFKDGIRKA